MSPVLSGNVYEGTYVSDRYYVNAAFPYAVHVPAYCGEQKECALILTHDGLNREEAAAELLYQCGCAPACITIGVSPGTLRPLRAAQTGICG